MAQLSEVKIRIGATEILQFSDVVLRQKMYNHHEFKIVCPAEVFGPNTGHSLETSQSLIGAKAIIIMQRFGGLEKGIEFMGIVTNVQALKYSGHVGDIIITGFSPTIVLDHGQHCLSWLNKSVSQISKDVLGVFESDLFRFSSKPVYKETIPYVVQYQETAWQFMNRIAATYGEWLFYNGKELVLGEYKQEESTLIFGATLTQFGLSMQVSPVSFSRVSYDYENNKTYKESPTGIEDKAGLNELGKLAFQKSKEVFNTNPKSYTSQYVNNQAQLKHAVDTSAAEAASTLIRFSGSANSFGVQLASNVTVTDKNGSFRVIEVEHKCDGQGNYHNDFVAIPASIKVPPVLNYATASAESQPAIVTANHDEAGLGRVQVRFKWMKPNEHTPWIRVVGPHAGGGKGMFFMPELEEEAIVDFENGDPTKPFVIGTVYHGSGNNSYSNAGNDVKALQTRSGNKIVMNDKDGSVHVTDKGGADTMMDGAGNITTNAKKNYTTNVGEVETSNVGTQSITNVGGQKGGAPQSMFKMDNGGNIVFEGKTSFSITIGASKFTMNKDGNITLSGKNIKVVGSETTEVGKAGGNPGMKVDANVTIKGGEVDIN